MDYEVFPRNALEELVKRHQKTLQDIHKVEVDLKSRLAMMDEAIDALILAAISGEPLLFIGPPGTAKSYLIREFCQSLGIEIDKSGETSKIAYFEYLLTPFTEPSELFGYYDIPKAINEKKLERLTTGMMQNARVVYLDEVFNASSAILNSILAFMNERIFHDRGKRERVEMQFMFGSTNSVPYTPELRAVYDRFLLRCWLEHVDAKPDLLYELTTKAWSETYGSIPPYYADRYGAPTNGADQLKRGDRLVLNADILKNLDLFLLDVRQLTINGGLKPQMDSTKLFYREIAKRVQAARDYGYSDMSNRRLVRMLHVMLVHAVYQMANGRQNESVFNDDQMKLLKFALDTPIEDQTMAVGLGLD